MSEATPQFEAEAPVQRALPAELGRYVLLRELGSGGMASVYLGRMRLTGGLERLVAVKTIHDHLADQPSFVDMFLDEANIATQIVHPNVCVVHDFGSADGVYYLSMEYLVGEPLSAVVRRLWDCASDEEVSGAMPFMAARILADACEGLHAAHETRRADGKRLEVVHRDVSPQNLFVTYEGSVKVVDFGCAKAIQRITETSAGIFKGKVAYAAPEQLKIQKLDARTDVWALGVCLWEMLTLERLFKRDTPMATARAILSGPIPRADEQAPWVPVELADVAERALRRDPEERYQTAREMGRDLRQLIARSGATFESAELAEWMEYLFADQRAARLEMAAEAEGTLASQVVPTPRELEPTETALGDDGAAGDAPEGGGRSGGGRSAGTDARRAAARRAAARTSSVHAAPGGAQRVEPRTSHAPRPASGRSRRDLPGVERHGAAPGDLHRGESPRVEAPPVASPEPDEDAATNLLPRSSTTPAPPAPSPAAPDGRPPTISRPLLLAEEDRRDRPHAERSSLWWAVPLAIVLVTAVTLFAFYLATRL